ncbi:MAG: DUF5074 domain-containing protein [Flavobacteriales bacterium]|nr:DUF5074 domain-containing protein [Flavobacteriales bacterium]
MKQLLHISLIMLLFTACTKEEFGPQCLNCDETPITQTSATDVLIINEGTFGWTNASISLYNKNTNNVNQNVFKNANNGLGLGDVAQSFMQIGSKGYIVVNNSNKVEVVNMSNFTSVATITGFNSPRYMLPINTNKAYVSDLYSNSIQVVNLASNTISKSISVSGWTEQMVLFNDTAYVCDMTNNNILIINTITDVLVDSIKVGKSPNSIVLDKNNQLWVMCSGGFSVENPKLIQLNPANRSITQTLTFPNIADSPGSLTLNATKDVLYFLNSNVYQMSISSTALPSSALIANSGNIFYGLGVDPNNNDVYVSDAIDYVQNGTVFRYSSSGNLIHQFTAGVIPGNFWFIE